MRKFLSFLPSIIWFCVILYLSFTPKNSFNVTLQLFEHQDKIVHICMYFIFIVLLLRDLKKQSGLKLKYILISILILASISVCIEILQPILSNRSREYNDVFANILGLFIGAIFARKQLKINIK